MHGWSAGLTYGIHDGLALTVRSPLYYVDQRGIDAFLFGVTASGDGSTVDSVSPSSWNWTWHIGSRCRRSPTLYTLQLSGDGERWSNLPAGRAVHVLASMRWAHVSHASLAGRDRNPDIEAIGPQVGILMGF